MVKPLTAVLSTSLLVGFALLGHGFAPAFVPKTRFQTPSMRRESPFNPLALQMNMEANPNEAEPVLSKEEVAAAQLNTKAMEAGAHEYLINVFDDDRTLDEIHEADAQSTQYQFVVTPKATFAQAAYFANTIPFKQDSELAKVLPAWFMAAQNFHIVSSQLAQKQEAKQPFTRQETLIRLSVAADLHKSSEAVLEAVKLDNPSLDIEEFHPQQWLIVADRLNNIVMCNAFAKGRLNNDMETEDGRAFNEAFAEYTSIVQHLQVGQVEELNWVLLEYYSFLAVYHGEKWFAMKKNERQSLMTFNYKGHFPSETPQTGKHFGKVWHKKVKTPEELSEEKEYNSLFWFPQLQDEDRKPSQPTRPRYGGF